MKTYRKSQNSMFSFGIRAAALLAVLTIVSACTVQVHAAIYADYSTYPLYTGDSLSAEPLEAGSAVPSTAVPGTVYSQMDYGYAYATNTAGLVGFEDYDSINDEDIALATFRFVGGVAAMDEVMWFDFFDSGYNYVDSFGVMFPLDGDWIWTISLTTPMTITDAGILEVIADDGFIVVSTGTWYLGSPPPTIGTNDPFFGTFADGSGVSHTYELNNIPEPVTVSLLGLGSLVLLRKRRA
jgi:hypothetical protein